MHRRHSLLSSLSLVVPLALGGACGTPTPNKPAPVPAEVESPPADTPEPTPLEPSAEDDSDSPTTIEVTLFYPPRQNDDCTDTRSITRTITPEPDRAAQLVRMLLEGPSPRETEDHDLFDPFEHDRFNHLPELKDLGAYFSGVQLTKARAVVDFDDAMALEYVLNDTACASAAVHGAILRTLSHAFGVSELRFRVEGRLISEEGGA